MKTVEVSPLTDTFMAIADQAYSQIVSAVPRAATLLTRARWNHVHRLMLARRIEDCHFAATGRKPAAPVRTPLPSTVRVFQPIWDMLAAIGITTFKDTSTIYVPTHPLPNSQDPEDWSEDFVVALSTCQAQDWAASWEAAKYEDVDRSETPDQDVTNGVDASVQPEIITEYASVLRYQRYRKLSKYLEARKSKDSEFSSSSSKQLSNPELDAMTTEEIEAEIATLPKSRDEALAVAARTKLARQAWTPRKAKEVPEVNLQQPGDHDVGAYGKWLGWSPQLWIDYTMFVQETEIVSLYSLSFPNDKQGTMAWVVQHYTVNGQDFCKVPTRTVPQADAILGVIMKAAPWERRKHYQYISTWNVETDKLGAYDITVIKWLSRALKQPPTVIPTYT
jgi:hypothetical protein